MKFRSSARSFNSEADERPKKPATHAFLMGRAVRLLSIREYSEAELRSKLSRYTEDATLLQAVLTELQSKHWQSDERYVAQKIHQRSAKLGQRRILQELKQHAVSPELIHEASEQLTETEEARLLAVWQKKFGTLATDPNSYAKQLRFLLYRGFSSELIHKVFAKLKNNSYAPFES